MFFIYFFFYSHFSVPNHVKNDGWKDNALARTWWVTAVSRKEHLLQPDVIAEISCSASDQHPTTKRQRETLRDHKLPLCWFRGVLRFPSHRPPQFLCEMVSTLFVLTASKKLPLSPLACFQQPELCRLCSSTSTRWTASRGAVDLHVDLVPNVPSGPEFLNSTGKQRSPAPMQSSHHNCSREH